MPEEVKRKLDLLTEAAQQLTEEIDKLHQDSGDQNNSLMKRLTRNKRIMIMVLASFAVDLGVTIALAVTLNSTEENTNRIDQITQRLDYNQTVQRRKVLCPLYQIFMDSKSDAARKVYPKGAKEYDRVFGIIENGYNAIDCGNSAPPALNPPPLPKG